MHAARLFGNMDIRLENEEIPEIKDSQMLVEVYSASVNPIDVAFATGIMRLAPLPATLGGDFAGIVRKVGKKVKGFEEGEEVYGYAPVWGGGTGSFAEYIALDPNRAAKRPEKISLESSAALALVGICAYDVLINKMKIKKGDKILIHGGTGGIGHIAVQIAKALGAYVATTVNSSNAKLANELGADMVISYDLEKFEEKVKDFDVVFDTAGKDAFYKSFGVVKKGGRLISMAAKPDAELAKKYSVNAEWEFSGEAMTTENLEKLAKFVDANNIRPIIHKAYALEDAAKAIEEQTKRHAGKILIKTK